ncbi:MAG: alpha/beta hydrolase [Pseudomonadota bacterium]
MKLALLFLLVLVLLGAAFWVFGPREPVARAPFDPKGIGDDIDAYLARNESAVPDIRPGAAKRVDWAGEPGRKTPVALVYLHGFSASASEISPVPEQVAQALGANLYFARFAGHGRDGAAMATATLPLWRRDVAEALAIGARLGERVIVMATSTGAPLLTLEMEGVDLAGVVLISPNFKVRATGAVLLNMPYARAILPRLLGPERGFEPETPGHAAGWTTRYPTQAVVPMAAAVEAAAKLDPGRFAVPALFVFSDRDQVVDPAQTRQVAQAWGGPVTLAPQVPGPGDDQDAHVLAGDAMSPGLTEGVVQEVLRWVETLEQ